MPLFARIVVANVLLLLATCVAIFVLLDPRRVSEIAADELLIAALALVVLLNTAMVRHIVVPLQKLTARARRLDPAQPGERIRDASLTSEAGELATTLNEMLDRLELERAQAARRVLAAHESERLRVAQELHDEVGQTLTAVLLQLGRVQDRLPPEMKHELAEAQDAARSSLEDVRRIATELRPEVLRDLGLSTAVEALCDTFSTRTGIAVHPVLPNVPVRLADEAELAVYRIAQEGLTNVARHSGSNRVELALARRNGSLTLRIRDHGKGMRPRKREGNGIRGMQERAMLAGGTLTIGPPSAGEGTELALEVPLGAGQ